MKLLNLCFAFCFSVLVSCQSGSSRQVIDMNTGWAFFRGEVDNGAQVDLDVTGWMPICLPHIMCSVDKIAPSHCVCTVTHFPS